MVKDRKRDDGDEMVRVLVKRGIAYDGVAIRPRVDESGKRGMRPNHITPIEAVIPRRIAEAHGPDDVEILGPADPAGKQAATPADKQVTGSESK